jgi:hypothetical protein
MNRNRRTFCTEEFAGDVESLTSHHHDLLTVKQLLGDDTGQATQKVSLAVDNDLISNTSQSAKICDRKLSIGSFKTGHWTAMGSTYNWLEGGHPALVTELQG